MRTTKQTRLGGGVATRVPRQIGFLSSSTNVVTPDVGILGFTIGRGSRIVRACVRFSSKGSQVGGGSFSFKGCQIGSGNLFETRLVFIIVGNAYRVVTTNILTLVLDMRRLVLDLGRRL